MAPTLPLPTLLSQALVAFTIEFDNEFEHRVPHRTTRGPVEGGGPWLVSQAMWANFMRLVPEAGAPLRELEGPARLTNLAGLVRWGYVTIAPDPADPRGTLPRAAWLVRPTIRGRRAQDIWRPLDTEIEERWATRFGGPRLDRLRAALEAIVTELDPDLPAYLPVLGYGLWTRLPGSRGPLSGGEGSRLPLSALLSTPSPSTASTRRRCRWGSGPMSFASSTRPAFASATCRA